jgi:spore maturation protein SpmB
MPGRIRSRIIGKTKTLEQSLNPSSLRDVFLKSSKSSFFVSIMLIKMYIPLSILTIVLKQSGLLDRIAPLFSPLMGLMGLPGDSAIILLSGFMNLFGGLGAMAAFDLSFRQITILGVVLGLSHALFVETGVLVKLGMARARIALFRMAIAISAGIIMNLVMPSDVSGVVLNPYHNIAEFSWLNVARSLAFTSLQIIVVLFVLTLAYELIVLWKHAKSIKKSLSFIPRAVGFSERAFGPWVVGFFVGIGYGAGILYHLTRRNQLSHKDICLTTVFLILAHAIIEDTMLFVVLGGNIFWILITRLSMAFLVVRLLSIGNIYKRFLWIGLPKKKVLKRA